MIEKLSKSIQLKGNASLHIYEIESNINYSDLTSLEEQATVPIFKFMDKRIPCPRKSVSFGKNYQAPAVNASVSERIPLELSPFVEAAKLLYPHKEFEQALVTIYRGKSDYIGFHSDKGNPSVVVSFTLYSDSQPIARKFKIKSKSDPKDMYTVRLLQRQMVVMHGTDFQKLYLHAVEKGEDNSKRLNITLRSF